jgi:hypothetical protein
MPGEQERVRMRRRAFIAIFGSALLGGTALLWRNLSSAWRSRIDEHAAQTVKAPTDLMFPGDGLPGATELGIHNRVLAMAELRDTVAEGVGWLDRQKIKALRIFLRLTSGIAGGIGALCHLCNNKQYNFVRFCCG